MSFCLEILSALYKAKNFYRDRMQKQREEALADFRKGSINVLVATDVCARGIDVKDLQHVSLCTSFVITYIFILTIF